jgi:hypothetical protein
MHFDIGEFRIGPIESFPTGSILRVPVDGGAEALPLILRVEAIDQAGNSVPAIVELEGAERFSVRSLEGYFDRAFRLPFSRIEAEFDPSKRASQLPPRRHGVLRVSDEGLSVDVAYGYSMGVLQLGTMLVRSSAGRPHAFFYPWRLVGVTDTDDRYALATVGEFPD